MRPSWGRRFSAILSSAHDLDARGDARLQGTRQGADRLVEQVVDPEAHADLLLEGLDVDVARALLHRLLQQGVHELDDRCLVRRLDQVLRHLVADLVGERVEVGGRLFGEFRRRPRATVVDLVDRGLDYPHPGQLRCDLGAVEEQPQVVEGAGLEGVGYRDPHRPRLVVAKREQSMGLGKGDRHACDKRIVDALGRDLMQDGQTEARAEGGQKLLLGKGILLHQDVEEPAARLSLTLPGGFELLGGKAGRAEQRGRRDRAPRRCAPRSRLGSRLGLGEHADGRRQSEGLAQRPRRMVRRGEVRVGANPNLEDQGARLVPGHDGGVEAGIEELS